MEMGVGVIYTAMKNSEVRPRCKYRGCVREPDEGMDGLCFQHYAYMHPPMAHGRVTQPSGWMCKDGSICPW